MSETEADKLDLAVECFKSGLSLADSATRYGLSLASLEAEVERRAKAKRNESSSSKNEYVYESAQMEDAVNSVLCGMSIKDAATAYGVSKNALKQALRQELDKEPVEEGALVVAEEPDAEESNALYTATDPLPDPLPDPVTFKPDMSQNVVVIEPTIRRLSDFKTPSLKTKEELGDEIEVHCGHFDGTLHRTRFLCPGLRSECIELPDGRWVTPKTFSIIGGKASLKNWKNAVRINNVSLRHYMDAGLLDFFEHETNCSGKCSHKSGGSLGKYQSRINSMKLKTAIDLQTQEELTASGKSTPQQDKDKNTNDSTDPPALLPFVENISASPAFTVLRQAQGKDTSSTSGASQPVFPMPTLLPENKLISTDGGADVGITSFGQKQLPKAVSLIPANIAALTKNVQKFQGRPTPIPVSVTSQTTNPPQTIIVRPINDSAKSASLIGQPRPVTYLVPTSSTGSRVQLPLNSVLLPVSSSQPQAPAVHSTSSFPNIDNIMKDSGHFWKGILDIGLLELIIHDMKVQLSTIKRRALQTSAVGASDAKALSKVAGALWMQESIRQKLADKKDDMKRQNDRIQNEIDELKRKMEMHERRQQELKRKSDMFEELMSKRPCIQADSSDDEAEWSNSATSAQDKTQSSEKNDSPTPINIVPVNESENNKKSDSGTMKKVSPVQRDEASSTTPTKSVRNSRKSFVPVKKPATPTQVDDVDIKDEIMDIEDANEIEKVMENGNMDRNGVGKDDVSSGAKANHGSQAAATNGDELVDNENSAEEEDPEGTTENDDENDEDSDENDGSDENDQSNENGVNKVKPSPMRSMRMVIRMPGSRSDKSVSKTDPRHSALANDSDASEEESL